MVKTKIFYGLPTGYYSKRGMNERDLNEVADVSNKLNVGKSSVASKHPDVLVSVYLPLEGNMTGLYEVMFKGKEEEKVAGALTDFIKASGMPDFTKGKKGLVSKVLEPHGKKLKYFGLFYNEVIDA